MLKTKGLIFCFFFIFLLGVSFSVKAMEEVVEDEYETSYVPISGKQSLVNPDRHEADGKEATNLTCLAISDDQVHINLLSSLAQFENLAKLYLWGTQLTTLENISSLLNLQLLDLKSNQISSLRGLHTNSDGIKFPKLGVLILKNNRLTSQTNACLNFLLELPLVGIDLSDNLLTKIPALGTISTLRRLDISGNDIEPTLLQGYKNTRSHTYLPQRTRN